MTVTATTTPAPATRLGMLIFTARDRAGLSQSRLGEMIGRPQSTISSWENGRKRPSAVQIVRLANHLGLTPEALILAVASDVASGVSTD